MTPHYRRDLVALALCQLALLAMLWVSLRGTVSGNENYDYFCCYEPSARNLLDGHGFVYDNGRFADLYPPGYPLLVATALWIGRYVGTEAAHRIIIAICDVATVLLVYSSVRRLGSRAWALAAGFAVASYPFHLWLGKQPNSETPFLVTLALALYCFIRLDTSTRPMAWAAGVGLATGLACMFRSIGLFLVLPFAVAALLCMRQFRISRRIALAVVMLVADVAIILPWELILTRNGGFALLGRNSANSLLDGLTFGIQHPDSGEPVNMSPALRAFMLRANSQAAEMVSTRVWVEFVRSEWRRDPQVVFEWLSLKLRRVWYATHTRRAESAIAVIQAAYLALSVAGLWIRRRTHSSLVMALILLTFYCWAMAVVVMPLLRYMVPIVTLLMIPAAAAFLKIANRVLRRDAV